MTTLSKAPVRYVDTPVQLRRLCDRLKDSPFFALDTEFLRESTYHPQFCLLQIAAADQVACVDPIRLPDLDPLWQLLYESDATKVFHAGFQDLEIFHHLHGRLPAPVFDTQLAAPLLGYGDQIGYAQLVEEVLGVTLGKGHSRTDWRRRPLSPQQIDYAADDVRYLVPLYLELRRRLEESGRVDWLSEDFERLTRPETYRNPPQDAWRRIKGTRRLKGRQLAALKRLAAWREETARRENLPRGWVVKDDLLCHIARLQPQNPQQLKQLRGLSDKAVARYGQDICAQVAAACDDAPEKAPPRPPARTPRQEALLDLLSAVVRLRAEAQNLHPNALASRKDLEKFLADPAGSRLCQGWRQQVIGDDLVAFLEGRRHLRVVGGEPVLDEAAA
ncbi:ribonuclease D [Methylomarinovum caldicuralii]|uniref:Ribonuclease D n=1 Tax=Methylomarinovum caldicuralii TaxID=438856 RepID=A0AAU9C7U7_9GAMM|nr:ribonuclease D [Methylomarinovum caldicuralii]BCX80494.1 ribonuclease D [Methylomarinovum caldicuralii]